MRSLSPSERIPRFLEHDGGRVASWVLRTRAVGNASPLTVDEGFFLNVDFKAREHRLQGVFLTCSDGSYVVFHFEDQAPPAAAALKIFHRFKQAANLTVTPAEALVPLDALHLEQFGWVSVPTGSGSYEQYAPVLGAKLAPARTLSVVTRASFQAPRPLRISYHWFGGPVAFLHKTRATMPRERLQAWVEFRLQRAGLNPEACISWLPAFVAAALDVLCGPKEVKFQLAQKLFDGWARARRPSYRRPLQGTASWPAEVTTHLESLQTGKPPAFCPHCAAVLHPKDGKCKSNVMCPGNANPRKCRTCREARLEPRDPKHWPVDEVDARERRAALVQHRWALRVLSARALVEDPGTRARLREWFGKTPKDCKCHMGPSRPYVTPDTCAECVKRFGQVTCLNELRIKGRDDLYRVAEATLQDSLDRLKRPEVRVPTFLCKNESCRAGRVRAAYSKLRG